MVDGQVVGGFAYTGLGAGTVQLHFVGTGPHWVTRTLLRIVFTYCFQQLGVKVILGYIAPERLHAVKVAEKLGFTKIAVIPGVGIHLMAMIREDCRWLDLPSRGVDG